MATPTDLPSDRGRVLAAGGQQEIIMKLGMIGRGRMGNADFADSVLSALRYQFGGHEEKQ